MSGWFVPLLTLSLFPSSSISIAINCDQLPDNFQNSIRNVYKKCAQSESIGADYTLALHNKNSEEQLLFGNKSLIKAGLFLGTSDYKSFTFSGKQLVIDAGNDEISFSYNPVLETIHMPGLKTFKASAFILEQNAMLKNFTFPESAKIITPKFNIRGNRRLERRWLELLKKSLTGTGYIQEYGECFFRGRIKDVAELEGCKYINGNLNFFAGATQSPTYSEIRLSKVTGCITIQHTHLTSISFLKNTISDCKTGHAISENPLICDTDILSGNITGNGYMENNCHFVCLNMTELISKKTCHALNSDLIVDQDTDLSLLEDLKRIKRVNGIVKVTGTELNKIDFLKNLWFVVSKRPGPALIIRDNVNLKELVLDQLTDSKFLPGMVVAPTTFKVYVKHNGNYKMPKEQFKKLQKILIDPNSIEADVDMELPKDIYSDRGHDENDKDFDFHESVKEENNNFNPTKSLYFITVFSAVAVGILFIAEVISIVVKYATFKYKQQIVNMDAKEKRTPKVEPKPVSVTASDRSFLDTPNEENKSSMKAPTESDNSNVTSRNSNPSPINSDVSIQQVASQNPLSQNQSSQQQK